MDQLNRFGRMRLDYLTTCRPDLLLRIEREGRLQEHLLALQRHIDWELEQMMAAGLEEEKAESYLLGEFLHNPDLV
ncbi:hypothetical protein JCM30471_21050 [Desulfuromonas carbonis]|uniref:TnpV protein n=1 Tax=Desulfuromonas sp. DDH964 TaxID=1823759 RepID=UPI00078B6FB5|nr:TnpV protein [Desulfuromonas sp. DDH964]AMV73686.1 hypothetical protein DBW_3388 [Desulfuromonas sp. DDH964]